MQTINDNLTQINYCGMTDEYLVKLVQEENNEEAISTLFKRYRGLILFFSKRYFIQGADLDDAFQESLIGFYKAAINFKFSARVSFVIFAKICINRHLISSVKKANSNKNAFLNKSVSLQAKVNQKNNITYGEVVKTDGYYNPEKWLMSKESLNELLSSKFYLTNFEKRALFLVLEGYNHSEAGEIMGTSSKGIQNVMYRIRKKLSLENIRSLLNGWLL